MNLLDLASAALADFQGKTPDPGARYRHWVVHFADQDDIEVIYSDDQTHAQVLQFYPEAVAAEPIAYESKS